MLLGINIFDFRAVKNFFGSSNVNYATYLPVIKSGVMPGFILVTDEYSVNSVSIKLIDSCGEVIYQNNNYVATAANGTTTIVFQFQNNVNVVEGEYTYEVTISGRTYYSDPFAVLKDVSKLTRIMVSTSDMTVAANHVYPASLLNYDFYINTKSYQAEPDVVETGVEKPYGDIPSFSTSNYVTKASVLCNSGVVKFLSTLRAFGVNGNILIEHAGITSEIYDTTIDIGESSGFGVSYTIDFTFKELNFLSSRNEI